MNRTRLVLLALVTTVVVGLLAAGPATAAITVIDARDDSPGSRWVPNDVTIQQGDTVRWEFDDALVSHNVNSTSDNWDLASGNVAPDDPPVEHTFADPGTYTFLCTLHPGMSGTVTVEEAAPLENVLVFSKTAGFRHSDSIPQGIAAIQQLGTANGFEVDASEDATVFTDANLAQYDVVVFLSTTGDILNDDQQAAFERYIQSGGGYAGIHAASDTEYTWPWYGELVGGYFRSHPPGTPTATVDIEDGDEPSTTGLPASWTRTDEWYNFQDTTEPVVNGNTTVADYSPRARGIHVLATVDEATYDEQDGNTVDDDHPVAWCSEFDGGRSWYTAMGHTPASFTDAQFRQHLLGGLQTAAGASAECGERRDPPPTADEFEKVTLDDDTKAPMEIAPAPDGRVFYIELGQPVTGGQPNEATAELMVWDPDGDVSVAHTLTVDNSHENGLLGLTLAPDFPVSGHLYMSYSRFDPSAPATAKVNVVSRFTVGADSKVVADSEVPIYTWTHQRQECCHTGGSLSFGPDGSLYVSTGDNTNPFAHNYNPTDERPGREPWDAQRTSANTNNANGKVLRIVPKAAPLGTPGMGTTYDIPAGNMFPAGTAQTLPEIYAMGFRNPFRIHVDKRTGWVLLGDYGPDARTADPNRGPQGSVEFNVLTEPGFYGWPYCVRENVAYNDITYTANNGAGTNNGKYSCAAPVNDSPNNTGLTNLPPAKPATMWLAYTEADNRFPGLGTGGAPTGGPRYYYDEDSTSDSAFPRFYDGQWFIGEWNNDWVKTATLNDKGLSTGVSCFAICSGYVSPMDLEFGADGSLYVAEWGQGFAENNADSGVYRIDYVKGDRAPIARAAVTPDAGPLPLTVQFSSAGSNDPDGTALAYAWDFDGDGDTDSTDPNPTHTYTTAGTFQAKLTVTDEAQAVGTDVVTVIAGNSRPVVTIELPENGRVADFGEKIPYRVSVTDAEDGATGNGINCDNVQLEFKLGHDTHSHEISSATGCQGEFTLPAEEGHGSDANVFTVMTAAYSDRGAGAAGSVTGRAEAIVQPRLKQADFWQTTGRTPDSRATSGDPGSVNEATTDVGAGQSAAFIEDGDWISFNPYNLEDLTEVTFRVASAGAGGIIELRYDAADGPLVAATENIAPTGGWQTWRDVTLDLPASVPEGTHRLFLVFRHPTATGSLMNLNWFKFSGKGAAVTAPPEVTASAEPASGEAPLEVAFDATAVDPEGEALTYEWNFGVSGTTADSSTLQDPTYTYERAGNYTATVKATDAQGASSTATVDVRVTRKPDQCPTGPARSDEFDGDALDTDRWTVLRPDAAHPFSVADGELALPVPNGSMYAGGTTAKNVIVQPTPDGEWTVTAKITAEGLAENYQQAGLRVWSDDDHWASVHMISAGGNRDFEFIYENDGNPRNDPADKLGGIPATSPTTYYVRLTSDGTTLTASYSYDGDTFLPVGRSAPMSSFSSPQIGPAALSGDDPVTTTPVAYYDWIRFDPDGSTGGSGILDEFDGTELGSAWDVVRRDQALQVSGSALHIPAAPGDLYQDKNDANNLVLRDAPDGAWTATAKIAFEGTTQWHQAGMLIYGDDNNFTKLGRLSTNAGGNGDEKFEFIYENNGVARNAAEDSTANLPAAFPKDYFVRITSDGTNITGAYSTDGAAWTNVGRPAPLPANAKIGLFAFSNAAASSPMADFDWFQLEGDAVGGGGGGPVGPSYDDHFDGSSLDKSRWNAIVRDVPAEYDVAGGKLTITTSVGDIYTGDTNPPPNNFILQSADHAGDDWVIETKLDGATLGGGYAQGGLLAYVGGDDYVKFDALTDPNNTQINRIELRSEVDGAIQEPQPQVTFTENHPEIWLRLTKTGTSYKGEYSFDGETWQQVVANGAPAQVTNAMEAPAFGLFAFAPQPVGVGVVPFEYFTLDGEDPPACGCTPNNGDEFGGSSLDKSKWDAIVRDDPTKYVVEDGALTVTTVPGEIYRDNNPANTGTLFLQSADHAGADYVLETTLSGTIVNGWSQGGIMVHGDDDNYVKFVAISDDGQNRINRVELRSEVDSEVPDVGPNFDVPAGTQKIGLRLTKAGQSYTGEVSIDGGAWAPMPAGVTNAIAAPDFGLFTAGVQDPGKTVTFDYFALDGKRGCPGEEPENEAPVLGAVAATPTSGFAPLPVEFTSDATDADDDELTYSWDFDGDGDEDADIKDAAHTYAQAGVYDAKATVSDGEDSASKTVRVTVLPADDPSARFRALVFSKTTGFRHSSIDEGIAAIKKLGQENGFQVDATEEASVFRDGVLSHFDTVVFLSTTGDVLNVSQQGAFERYIGDGGGYTGIHSASDTEYDWRWYGNLVGAYFRNHPDNQTATVNVEDQEHPSSGGLPDSYSRLDEWYNFKAPAFAEVGDADFSPRARVHVLATVNESTYDEDDGNATDDDHPVTWCQRYDGGRSWYTAMGHTEESFVEANFLHQVLGGIETTAGAKPSASCGIPPDLVAPTSRATLEPASPAKGPVAVTLAADDDAGGTGVDKIEYKVDGAADWTAYSGPFTVSAEGKHTVTFRATDIAGNVENAKSIDVVVDLTAPTTSHTLNPAQPDKKSGVYKQPIQVTLSAGDGSGSGVGLTEYRINGSAWQPYPAPFTIVADGQYTVEYRSVDKAGNVEAAKSLIVKIKKPGNFTPPA